MFDLIHQNNKELTNVPYFRIFPTQLREQILFDKSNILRNYT